MRSIGSSNQSIESLLQELRALISELGLLDLGYPLGENRVVMPPDEVSLRRLLESGYFPRSEQFQGFYGRCDGLNLPDVHVGYFVHPAGVILRGIESGEPVRVLGERVREILVFGSDGGGGRFAITRGTGEEVYYLPSGAVHDGAFDGHRTPPRTLASSFDAFLNRLVADVRAFVEDKQDWRYMTDAG